MILKTNNLVSVLFPTFTFARRRVCFVGGNAGRGNLNTEIGRGVIKHLDFESRRSCGAAGNTCKARAVTKSIISDPSKTCGKGNLLKACAAIKSGTADECNPLRQNNLFEVRTGIENTAAGRRNSHWQGNRDDFLIVSKLSHELLWNIVAMGDVKREEFILKLDQIEQLIPFVRADLHGQFHRIVKRRSVISPKKTVGYFVQAGQAGKRLLFFNHALFTVPACFFFFAYRKSAQYYSGKQNSKPFSHTYPLYGIIPPVRRVVNLKKAVNA